MMKSPFRSVRSWLPALLLVGLSFAVSPDYAQAGEVEEVNPDLAAQLFLKILSYDRNLVTHSHGKLVLVIVYRPESADSERIRDAMQGALQERIGKYSVQGLPASVTTVAFDAKLLLKRLQTAGATVLYLTPGLEDQVGAIGAAAQLLKAPTLTGRRSLLDAGIALAVVVNEDRPGIVVNLPVAKALGMDLDPNLLRLADVKK